MDFVLSTGYMPVRTGAFAKIGENSFKSDAFKNLYAALTKTVATCTFVREPNFDGYYSKVRTLYDEIRKIQKPCLAIRGGRHHGTNRRGNESRAL